MILVAALVSPLTLALCVVGGVAAYIRRKRRHQRSRRATAGAEDSHASPTSPSKASNTLTQPYVSHDGSTTVVRYMHTLEGERGSLCGSGSTAGSPAMLPPSRDSTGDVASNVRTGLEMLRRSMNGLAAALGIHMSNTGGAY